MSRSSERRMALQQLKLPVSGSEASTPIADKALLDLYDRLALFVTERMNSPERLKDTKMIVVELGTVDRSKAIVINELQAGMIDPARAAGSDARMCGFIKHALVGSAVAMGLLQDVLSNPRRPPDVIAVVAPAVAKNDDVRYMLQAEQRRFMQRQGAGNVDSTDAVMVRMYHAHGMAQGILTVRSKGGVLGVDAGRLWYGGGR